MFQGSKLSDFERGRICELHKQGLSQLAIAVEIHRSKTIIFNFLNDPESYGKAKSTDRMKKNSSALINISRIELENKTRPVSKQRTIFKL